MMNNYRDILKEKLSDRCRKNATYSLRAFARDLEISPQRLSHILNGKHGLSLRAALLIARKLNMNENETNYFCASVEEKHARSQKLKAEAKEKLACIKSTYKDLSIDHFKIISDWYHFAIMELTLIDGFNQEPRWIARTLGIKEIEVKMALERLLKLEMLEQDTKGNLKLSGQFFADPGGVPSDAIRTFHRQLLMKAAESLDYQALEERDISSMIMAINQEDLSEAKADIKKFREEFDAKYSNTKKKTSVYCLGIQFYNLKHK